LRLQDPLDKIFLLNYDVSNYANCSNKRRENQERCRPRTTKSLVEDVGRARPPPRVTRSRFRLA